MLMVICKHIRTDKKSIMREGCRFRLGGKITRRMIETTAGLPDGYKVGGKYRKDNFEYLVLEK